MEYPKTIDECHTLAVKYLKEGHFDEAERLYMHILKLDPKFIRGYNNLGIILRTKGDLIGARKCYEKAIELDPKYFQGYSNLGNVFKTEGNFEEAIKYYKKSLAIDPNFIDAYNNMGGALQLLGRLAEAVEAYEKAIKIDPGYMDAYGNLGGVLLMLGRIQEAEVCLRIVEDAPNMPEPIYNLANLLKERGEIVEAAKLYEKVIKQRPGYSDAINGLLDCLCQLCDWKKVSKVSTRLDTLACEELKMSSRRPGQTPFTAISTHDDPAFNLQVTKAWSNYIRDSALATNPGFYFDRARKTHEKIRIGYLSRDFTDHPVGHLMKSMFAHHNKRGFEIYCFSFGGNEKNKIRNKIEKSVAHFVDISSMSFLSAAQRIHAEEIDILVDLMGHTSGNRLDIMAMRPSPIQISYLGFPGSIGADFIDYQIVDRVLVPLETEKYYDEKLIFMPDSYQINDSAQKVSKKNFKRKDFGLPDKEFVFCSFNRCSKITSVVFDSWMEILKGVPGSVLWLQKPYPETEETLKREAKNRRVDSNRLIFSKMIPLEQHLRRLPLADLCLDTFFYSGGATTSHALRMGVPVVTRSGKTYLSKMSSSLLTSVDLPELITSNIQDYENLVISLAKNPKRLKEVRKKLAENLQTTKLYDTKQFVKNLEAVYQKVFEVYLNGEKVISLEKSPTI